MKNMAKYSVRPQRDYELHLLGTPGRSENKACKNTAQITVDFM